MGTANSLPIGSFSSRNDNGNCNYVLLVLSNSHDNKHLQEESKSKTFCFIGSVYPICLLE